MGLPSSGDSIREAIAREEARIARLEGELEQTQARLQSLRAELSARPPSPPDSLALASSTTVPVTSLEKVALFRSTFRGREALVQYAGRLHRLHPGKTEVRIYDYVDCHVPMLVRMFDKRLRGYRAIGYVRDERLHDESALADDDSLPSLGVPARDGE